MKNVLKMSFGGLTKVYFLRQLFFGSLFFVAFLVLMIYSKKPVDFGLLGFLVVATLLYPYSRFVYEVVVEFILGDNVVVGDAGSMLWWKILMMSMCWIFSVFIAPVGLVGLFVYHRWFKERGSE